MKPTTIAILALSGLVIILGATIVWNPWSDDNDDTPPTQAANSTASEEAAHNAAKEEIAAYAAANPPIDAEAVATAAIEKWNRDHPSPTPSTPPAPNATTNATPSPPAEVVTSCVIDGATGPDKWKYVADWKVNDFSTAADTANYTVKNGGGTVNWNLKGGKWGGESCHTTPAFTGNLTAGTVSVQNPKTSGGCIYDGGEAQYGPMVGWEIMDFVDATDAMNYTAKAAGVTVTYNVKGGAWGGPNCHFTLNIAGGSSGSGSSGSGSSTTGSSSAQCGTIWNNMFLYCNAPFHVKMSGNHTMPIAVQSRDSGTYSLDCVGAATNPAGTVIRGFKTGDYAKWNFVEDVGYKVPASTASHVPQTGWSQGSEFWSSTPNAELYCTPSG